MKLYLLLCIITSANCFYTTIINPYSKEKIIRGGNIKIEEIPHQASLEYMKNLICGAVIIAKDWLLSAEKCFKNLLDININLKARIGTILKEYGGTVIDIKDIKRYSEEFPGSDVDSNLALVLLAESVESSEIHKGIPIANTTEDPLPGSLMTISGFGKIYNSVFGTSSLLKVANVTVLPREECQSNFDTYITSNRLFCATGFPHDTCYGDEGGPGLIGGKLVAIITDKLKCGIGMFPSVYTKVGEFYGWIITKTGPLL